MTDDPCSDLVARQYERWTYPNPIEDLDVWSKENWQWFDPTHANLLFWPEGNYNPALKILIAGCGTNQAAAFAYANPAAEIVAIDVSQPSLDHEQFLKDKHQLQNLQLHLLPIEQAPSLGMDFDLIVSTGVLHHMADPLLGLKALASCLRIDGVMGLMLYAKYGRIGVELLQSLFSDLGLSQDETALGLVKDAIAGLSNDHYVQPYLKLAPTMKSDIAIVDTFLPERDQSYTVDACLELVAAADLKFQGWFFKAPYYAHDFFNPENKFYELIALLPERDQWPLMERIHTLNACHYFTACHPSRSKRSYAIDFQSEEFLNFIPTFRFRCGIAEEEIFRPDWRKQLNGNQLAVMKKVDGKKSVNQIITSVHQQKKTSISSAYELEVFSRKLFKALWQLDFISIRLKH